MRPFSHYHGSVRSVANWDHNHITIVWSIRSVASQVRSFSHYHGSVRSVANWDHNHITIVWSIRSVASQMRPCSHHHGWIKSITVLLIPCLDQQSLLAWLGGRIYLFVVKTRANALLSPDSHPISCRSNNPVSMTTRSWEHDVFPHDKRKGLQWQLVDMCASISTPLCSTGLIILFHFMWFTQGEGKESIVYWVKKMLIELIRACVNLDILGFINKKMCPFPLVVSLLRMYTKLLFKTMFSFGK